MQATDWKVIKDNGNYKLDNFVELEILCQQTDIFIVIGQPKYVLKHFEDGQCGGL